MRVYIRNKSSEHTRVVVEVAQGSITVPSSPTNVTVSKLENGNAVLCLAPFAFPIVPLFEVGEEYGAE